MKAPAIVLTALLTLSAAPPLPTERPVAVGPHAMVATAQIDATKAGVAILKAGGNAVDAAATIAKSGTVRRIGTPASHSIVLFRHIALQSEHGFEVHADEAALRAVEIDH